MLSLYTDQHIRFSLSETNQQDWLMMMMMVVTEMVVHGNQSSPLRLFKVLIFKY